MYNGAVVKTNPSDTMPPLLTWGMAAVIIGSVTALFGAYWDEGWHTDFGRDTFWIPPHIVLYAGIALVGVAVAMWTFLSCLQYENLRATLRRGSLILGLIGLIATLGAAPIDDYWHVTFGRDAVLFSPPHTLGIFGPLALVGSALLEVSRFPGLSRRWLTPLGSAAVLALLLVMAFEYDADVPQFAVFWYVPILVVASTFAFALSHNVSRDEWIATKAALLYTALMVGVFIFLTVLGLSKPIIPAVIIPALVFDLAARRRLSRPILAGLFTVVWFATYALYLNYLTDGVRLGLLDLAVGIPLAFVLSWLTLILTSTGWPRVSPKVLALLTVLLVASLSSVPALAHDPGQGDEIGQMQVVASVMEGGGVNVAASILGVEDCDLFNPVRITARRAGQTLHGTLDRKEACSFSGEISLPERGRWFVYAELNRSGEDLEAWIAVFISDNSQTFERLSSLYIPPESIESPMKVVVSVIVYAINPVLVGAVIVLFRRQARTIWGAQEVRGGPE